jgi:hypothetical protein
VPERERVHRPNELADGGAEEAPCEKAPKGAAKRPVYRNYRMAWCAAVTLHDKDGDALRTIRCGPIGVSISMAMQESMRE